jgi:peptidoglycan/LPS O-acetylase OafA/YrhL
MAMGCGLIILGGYHLRAFHNLPARILSWPGKLSYGCYIWHPTVLFLLLPLLFQLGGLRALLFLFLCVWFFAFLSYRYFEVPVNVRIRSIFGIKPSESL